MTMPVRDGRFAQLSNGIRLHYAASGDPAAPLMLFVHGFPEAWFAWEAQLAAFGVDHFAVAPDLRGFNLSSKPAEVEQYRADRIVEDLKLLIEALGHSRAIVVAHDWGGAIAWSLAILAPQWVERLIILNAPHPYPFARALRHDPAQQKASAYMNWFRKPGTENLLAQDDFRNLDAAFRGPEGPAAWYTPQVRARYHAMWSTPGEGGSHPMTGGLNYYRASALHPPTADDPGFDPARMKPEDWTVHVPTRVIWGEADTALLPVLLDGLDELVPDLRVTRVPQASHWLIHEQPEAVGALIRAALA